ncbi:MAG: hypothetical protein U9O59_01980 [Actinomycetota bacterium]|nr:hypothetical protein [Actinomycetota bacterium]
MSKGTTRKKRGKLPNAAFSMGVLGLILLIVYNVLWSQVYIFLESTAGTIQIAVVFCLSIASIICGSIGLNRIKKGLSSRKGRFFDTIGIILGIAILLYSSTLIIITILSLV